MDSTQLIPTPDQLQVPWGWFQVLLTVTFFIHLIIMNILLGCSVINFVRYASGISDDLSRTITGKLPIGMAFTINSGVAPLLFLQVIYGHLMYTSSVLMAFYWLAIIVIMIAAYYCSYIHSLNFDKITSFQGVLSGGIAVMLMAVGFIFTCNLALMVAPDSWFNYFNNGKGTFLNLSDPTLFPRFLHSVLASLAVGGMAIAFYYDLQKKKGKEGAEEKIRMGMRWFTIATFLNFGVGTLYWGSLPESVRNLTSDGGTMFLSCLLLGMASAVLSCIYGLQHRIRPALYSLLGSIFFMVLVREFARRMTLDPWFKTSQLQVSPQYSPLIVFLLVFGAGLWLVWYMIRLVINDKEVKS